MARKITTGEVGGAQGGVNITNTSITAAQDLNIAIDPQGTGIFQIASPVLVTDAFELRLGDADSSHWVGFKAPAVVATNRIWTLPAADGADGQTIVTDGAGTLSFGPAVPWSNFTQTTSFAAVQNGQYFVDTTLGVVTATLPAAPAVGNEIRFFDVAKAFDSFAFTVGRNGKLIMGDAADLTVTTEGAAFSLVFSGDTYGWRILTV